MLAAFVRSLPSRFASERSKALAAFVLYTIVIAIGALVHEPWWDEAQAWLIARDAPIADLYLRHVAYEGHPPLWHLLLAIPAKASLPYGSLKVVAALAALLGVYLLLFRLTFVPLIIRLLVPFTFFIAYQYTVVARSYVLLPPILWGIALLYERRAERFGTFTLLLILLSNVSVHGLAIASGLALLFLIDVLRGKIPITQMKRSTFILCTIAFVLNAIVLIVILMPPSDLQSKDALHSPLDLSRNVQLATVIFEHVLLDVTNRVKPPVAVTIASVLMLVLLFWAWRAGVFALLLLLALATFSVATVYYSPWHEGIFFLVLLFAMFVGFGRGGARAKWPDRIAIGVLLLVLLRHAQWAANSLIYDFNTEWTGSKAAAHYIAEHHLDRTKLFAAGLRTTEVQPYFRSNIFANYRFADGAFWNWSSSNPMPYSEITRPGLRRMGQWYGSMLAAKPDYILASVGFRYDIIYAQALNKNPDYRSVAIFFGQMYWKREEGEIILFQLFERVNKGVARAAPLPGPLPPPGERGSRPRGARGQVPSPPAGGEG